MRRELTALDPVGDGGGSGGMDSEGGGGGGGGGGGAVIAPMCGTGPWLVVVPLKYPGNKAGFEAALLVCDIEMMQRVWNGL